MTIAQKTRQHVWLLLLLCVLGSNTILYRTAFGIQLLVGETSIVVLGSLIDLVIIAPILFLAWKRQKSFKRFVLLMASGLILARFLIPMEFSKPFVAVTWVGFAVEAGLLLLELLLLVTLVRYMPRIVKATKESTLPIIFAFPNAVDRYVQKHQLIHIICSEMLMFYYAFATWRQKTNLSEHTITLHKKSSYIAFQIMLLHAIVIETIGIHWFLHEKSVILSIILLFTNIYSVIFILADIQVVRLNPLQYDKNGFYLSLGLLKRMEISWDDVEEVITEEEKLKVKLTKDTIDFVARDFDEIYPHVILKLKEPKEVSIILGLKKQYERVAIRLDDPQHFIRVLEQHVLINKSE